MRLHILFFSSETMFLCVALVPVVLSARIKGMCLAEIVYSLIIFSVTCKIKSKYTCRDDLRRNNCSFFLIPSKNQKAEMNSLVFQHM